MDNWQESQYSKSAKPISRIGILTLFCHYLGIPILTNWLAVPTNGYSPNASCAGDRKRTLQYCKVRSISANIKVAGNDEAITGEIA